MRLPWVSCLSPLRPPPPGPQRLGLAPFQGQGGRSKALCTFPLERWVSRAIVNAFRGPQQTKGPDTARYICCARTPPLVSPDFHCGSGPQRGLHAPKTHEERSPAVEEGGGGGRAGDGEENVPAGQLEKTLGLGKAQTPRMQRRLTPLLWREPFKSGLRL